MSHVDVQRVFPGRGRNRRVRRGVSAAAREDDIVLRPRVFLDT